MSVTTGRTVVDVLVIADGFATRLLGLQFRPALPPWHALLLVPCASVHTFCLRFALDLAMLDRDGRVLAVRRNVKPWRGAAAPRGTRAVLEMTAGQLAADVGEQLAAVAPAGCDVPRSVRFMAETRRAGAIV